MKTKGLVALLIMTLLGGNVIMAFAATETDDSLDVELQENVEIDNDNVTTQDIVDDTEDVSLADSDTEVKETSSDNEEIQETADFEESNLESEHQIESGDSAQETESTVESTENSVEKQDESGDSSQETENKVESTENSVENQDESTIITESESEQKEVETTQDEVENQEIVEETETEPLQEEIAEESVDNTPVIENYVGRNESEIPYEVLGSTTTIIKYVISEDAEEGTVLSQTTENGVTTLEIATAPVETSLFDIGEMKLLDSFDLAASLTAAPSVEDSTWDDYPVSYEYNWDNSQSAWNWGEWRDGVKYTTEQGTYDNNVRHAMSMYTDGEDIHLHISYATIYQSVANGDDFNFYIDGQSAKVRVLYADNGSGITGQARDTGTYDVVVVNGDHWNSGYEANGSYGTMIVKDGNINNELEIVIPLSTLQAQNSNIKTDNIQNIEFYTPNLMYRHISCGGASSGSTGFILLTVLCFGLATFMYSKRGFMFV